ncbi:MAG: 30S ribosomal protein S4 [Clostridiales bacterium]|jgi:small subunit ribosomal protein S4|nr:30S ribosomal protein S4 [Clostridiales bacterium]
MARYTGPVCRLCRREGEKLFLKGSKCARAGCPITKRVSGGNKRRGGGTVNAPGQHGDARKKMSEYGLQLRQKQKAKRIYGVLETQFKNYFGEAERVKGITGENLLKALELRLDNVVYRLGYGRSRSEARQVVRHNHIRVNGKKVNIPSYQVKVGDMISLKDTSKDMQRFKDILDVTESRIVPAWLSADHPNLSGKINAIPTREQIDTQVNETLIVELYSK